MTSMLDKPFGMMDIGHFWYWESPKGWGWRRCLVCQRDGPTQVTHDMTRLGFNKTTIGKKASLAEQGTLFGKPVHGARKKASTPSSFPILVQLRILHKSSQKNCP